MHSRARLMKEEVASKYLSPIMMQKILVGENSYYLFSHRRRTGEGYFANSLWPMSYLGVIWELYVLDLKTKVFCRKNNQILKTMDKGLTVPRWVL